MDINFQTALLEACHDRGEGNFEFIDERFKSNTVFFLKQGINRFLITDINNPAASYKADTRLPIMFDMTSINVQDFNHVPGGANVLFLDGHVSFEKYRASSLYPLSRAWATFAAQRTKF